MAELTPELIARQHSAAFDATSVSALAEQGLEVRRVDADSDGYRPWYETLVRGFLDTERTDAQVAANRERLQYRRFTGVYDATTPVPDQPVATIASWMTELSVPSDRAVPAFAISSVSVSPTHRRRGIARALMEGELRAARDVGAPVVVLTATEATLYGRYGFAAAAVGADWTIDTRRAGWLAAPTAGRVDYVSREQFRQLAPEVHERVRRSEPGEVIVPDAHWDLFAGTRPDAETPSSIRAIRFTDADGVVQGVATYTIEKHRSDFAQATADVGLLLAATPEAYRALWKFVLELDLVRTVRASLRAVDEPLRWLVADQRAITISVRDHQYVRIVDVVAALEARTFATAGAIVLNIEDRQEHTAGRWLLQADAAGRATVSAAPASSEGVAEVTMHVHALGALYLGGVSARVLHAASAISGDGIDVVDDLFRSRTAPRLSFWY